MPEQTTAVSRLAYEKSTHAPVFEQYRAGDFVQVGEENPEPLPWRIDPETGAEIHALGGLKGAFSSDLSVGSYYPATTFIFANDGENEHVGHEDLEAFLREHGLWSDKLNPVMVTQSVTGGPYLKPGFQYRPPESQPYSLDRVVEKVRSEFGLDDYQVLGDPDHGFQAMIGQ